MILLDNLPLEKPGDEFTASVPTQEVVSGTIHSISTNIAMRTSHPTLEGGLKHARSPIDVVIYSLDLPKTSSTTNNLRSDFSDRSPISSALPSRATNLASEAGLELARSPTDFVIYPLDLPTTSSTIETPDTTSPVNSIPANAPNQTVLNSLNDLSLIENAREEVDLVVVREEEVIAEVGSPENVNASE